MLRFLDDLPSRNNLYSPLEQIFDDFYDKFFLSELSPKNVRAKTAYPRWDIYTTKDDYVIEMSTTGCNPEDVVVEILSTEPNSKFERMLRVSGKATSENSEDSVRYYIRELRRSTFERSILLPNEIKGDPEATMQNGVLKLSWKLPKAQRELQETVKIPIKKLDK